jgi:hypothetical protein
MSTSGTYNYHPKVANPNKVFYQMKSETQQPEFYFGGSQVALYDNPLSGASERSPKINGSGIKDNHSNLFIRIKNEPKTRLKRI